MISKLLDYLSKSIDSPVITKSKKSLVIVGSAPLNRDYSKFIDSSDCVIRFNNCKNYAVNSGKKTDILILTRTGNPYRQKTLQFMLKDRSEEEINKELPYLKSAKQIWFARPGITFLEKYFKNNFPRNNKFRIHELKGFKITGQRDLMAEMINAQKMQEKKIFVITENVYIRTWQKLLSYGTTEAIMPSTGLLGIEMILDDKSFNSYEKYIIGFGFKGWKGHPWHLEKMLIKYYINRGILKDSIPYERWKLFN